MAGYYERNWQLEEGVRTCGECNLDKPYEDYYLRENGSPMGKLCRDCVLTRNRTYSMLPEVREKRLARQKVYSEENKEVSKQYLKDYYKSKKGRAKSMMKTAKRRSSKFSEETDLTEDYILDILENQDYCSVTGLKFDYEQQSKYKCNPMAPSIDRIDSTKGYRKDNVRMVIWQYNLMKGEMSDDDLYLICKEIISAREEVFSRGLDLG